MIFNTTYNNKEQKELITDLIGKPYSFFQAIRMKGVGSKRMIIEEVSPNMSGYINKVSDINYANIEIRKQGIIIHINKGLETFSWAIPFYQLVTYKTIGISFHAQGKFIRFKANRTYRENRDFFTKLQELKAQYDNQFQILNSTYS